jgi:hypothetical protein
MASAIFKGIKIGVKLPFLEIEGTWEVDEIQQKAAWEIYVELVTRISVQELKPDEGFLREALTSLYSLFATTREILKKYGPSIAIAYQKSDTTLGHISVAVLNKLLRPLLAKWHPLLSDHESRRGKNVSILEHERKWECHSELREEINKVRKNMIDYANVLAEVAGVASLI